MSPARMSTSTYNVQFNILLHTAHCIASPFSARHDNAINAYLSNSLSNHQPVLAFSNLFQNQVNESRSHNATRSIRREVNNGNGDGTRSDAERKCIPFLRSGSSVIPSGKSLSLFSQASDVIRRGAKETVPLPLPWLRHTRHVCPGTSRRTYVPLMKNPATIAEEWGGRGGKGRDSDTNFRRSDDAAAIADIAEVRETRNFGREISRAFSSAEM